jgi:hypothetical protein
MRPLLLALLLCTLGPGAWRLEEQGSRTHWRVRTSEGFDALCALNILSGDPYYIEQYPADARMFAQPRYGGARAAARQLKARLKDENGSIISAFLTLVFSGGPDSSLEAVLESARQPETLEQAFRASPFWSDGSWALFEDVRVQVVTALEEMERAGFAQDWIRGFEGHPVRRAAMLKEQLARYDVLGQQEHLIGTKLQNGVIEVILLQFSKPHGIRIQGGRFLTNIGYPVTIVLRNAAHEPLHPPFDAHSPRVAAAIASLSSDPLLSKIVAEHNPSFGYTTSAGYIEEDAVQALEQIVSERLGFSHPPGDRWRISDDGMHVLAAAFYRLMQETTFARDGGVFADWLSAAVEGGKLAPAEIERLAREVVGNKAVDRWKSPQLRRDPSRSGE